VERIATDDASEGQAIATRVKEELTLELCRYRDVRVILRPDEDKLDPSRPGQARFELRGRLRCEANGWRLIARLVDRTSGEQVWGDEYRTSSAPDDLDDAARVVAARVAAENGVIVQAIAASHGRHALWAGAYAGVLRSHTFFFARDLADFEGAVESLRHTVREQPEIALAWAHLARLYMVNFSFELASRPTPIEDAVSFANQAVRLDPTNARVRCLLASALLIKGEPAAARAELEETLRLNARSLVYLDITGYLLALSGDWGRGIDLVRTAMRRNPHHLPHVYVALWADAMRRGDFAEAYAFALENRDPMFFWRSLMRTIALGQLGRTVEASEQAATLLREKPTFAERGRGLIGHYLKTPDLQETVVDGLRKAGLSLA
jgi:tetratricopeptide (TPR) repeat protein